MQTNPLRQYFRQPAIYVSLPSKGQFYPAGVLSETANGEYPVLPMTTMDEITYRTPDALFNGSAVATVIQSCVPNIQDAWHVPNIDLDTLLIAIRIASYGHDLDVGSKCPSCSNETDYSIDLRRVLETITVSDYNQPMKVGDLDVRFRPLDYKQANTNNMAQFEQQKNMQVMEQAQDDQQRSTLLSQLLRKLNDVTTAAVADSVDSISTPDTVVSDKPQIRDWLQNCDRKIFNQVRDHVVKLRADSEPKPVRLKCVNCSHEYEQPFTLDMSNFFGDAS